MAQHSAAFDGGDPHEAALRESGTLVLRVWREHDAARALRVRILTSSGPHEPESTAVVADVDAAVTAVREWLEVQERAAQG